MKIIWKSDWDDDLIWCPSQCYRKFYHPLYGKDYTLYCRWRHEDPWTYDYYLKPGDGTWTDIGEGLGKSDNINRVHRYAEKLLKEQLELEWGSAYPFR